VVLSDAAAATGFADQSHLTRHFVARFGLTPGRFAKLARRVV
jgi:AraC-like DNA-binding protein